MKAFLLRALAAWVIGAMIVSTLIGVGFAAARLNWNVGLTVYLFGASVVVALVVAKFWTETVR